MERTDQELLAAHLDGNNEALHVLIKRYLKSIYNYTYRLSGNAEDAEDITQETFIKVWRHAKTFRTDENFKTWLFTIAHRGAIDLLRKKKRLVFSDFTSDDGESFFTDTVMDTEPLPDELFAKAEEKVLIKSVVAKLSVTHQEVLMLYYTEELTFDEIGKVLSKPLNTVKSQHRRALTQLRKLLENPENSA
jgi:RNA polymerase sigma-70 factor (ECF subfamily)